MAIRKHDKGAIMASKKYTLSLPSELYDELRIVAEKQGRSIKEVVRQCLKFGLIAIKIEDDPNSELYLKERTLVNTANGEKVYQEQDVQLRIVW